MRASHLAVSLVVAGAVCSCGYYPPSVYDSGDIRAVPHSQPSLRVRGLGDDDIHSLSAVTGLEYLDFGSGWKSVDAKITDKGLAVLGSLALPHLSYINLSRNDNITDDGVEALVSIASLRNLLLADCPGVTDRALLALASHPGLEGLCLDGNACVTDEGLGYLSTSESLTGLSLTGCSNVTESGVLLLARMKSLQSLRLESCPNIDHGAVMRIRSAMPEVRIAHADGIWSLDGLRACLEEPEELGESAETTHTPPEPR
ncbi:MAG: hypothetical protein KDC14_00505 [Planctomycetes bacterium]|nr:hypothetical protein [Planctomycetota bacterium]